MLLVETPAQVVYINIKRGVEAAWRLPSVPPRIYSPQLPNFPADQLPAVAVCRRELK